MSTVQDAPALTTAPKRIAKKRTRISAARLRANRLNALKSTGPKTAEGKARSRCNALKHGLAGAGIVGHEDDQAPLRERLEDWTADLGPTGSVESWLVGRAALASIRLDRAARMEAATLADRSEKAKIAWDQRQREHVLKVVGRLIDEPAESFAALQECATGCDWLLNQWAELGRALDDREGHRVWLERLPYLFGQAGKPTCNSAEPLASAWMLTLAAMPGLLLDEIDRFRQVSNPSTDPIARIREARRVLPDAETARAGLRAIVEAEMARLTALRASLWLEVDGPARLRAGDQALVDLSPTAALLRRYESAQSLELHRSLNQLAKLRKESAQAPANPLPARRRPATTRRRKPARSPVLTLRKKARKPRAPHLTSGENGTSDSPAERHKRRRPRNRPGSSARPRPLASWLRLAARKEATVHRSSCVKPCSHTEFRSRHRVIRRIEFRPDVVLTRHREAEARSDTSAPGRSAVE